MKIQFKDISFPEHYIRFKVDKRRVEDFIRIAAGLSPEQEIPRKPKLLNWPFPNIEVTKIEAKAGEKLTSEPEKGKGKKVKVKILRPYELIDGRHRMTALARFGIRETEAKIMTVKEPADRYLMQYHTNANGPLALEPYAKAQAIWTMVNVYHIKQAEVVKETNFTKASISRIASKKQGWAKHGGARPGAGRREGEAVPPSDGNGKDLGLFTPNQFVDRLLVMAGEYKKSKTAILKAAKDNLNHRDLDTLIEVLKAFVLDLENELAEKVA